MAAGTGLHVLGVRHHSPACAAMVADTILAVRPSHVLVEGPSDMNGRLDELRLDHRLPIAIFSHVQDGARMRGSWTPFCAYSPEWVALTAAREVGAQAFFMDLPAWDAAFDEVRNRYADRHLRASARLLALCRHLHVEDTDALWDHLFEQPAETADLRARLDTFFAELRGDDPLDPADRDARREAFMAEWVAWARAEADTTSGDVVVVCGGFHAPFLAGVRTAGARGSRPSPPEPPDGRHGSTLVPYSFHRLDSFAGYESGMPSPAFHQAVWDAGPHAAGTLLMQEAVTALRARGQTVSAADWIAADTLARGLARLRGHAAVSRTDALDGLAGALIKEALDTPLPWNQRGTLAPGTDPFLVALVATFSGNTVGRLDPRTPRPSLLADVAAELALHDLTPEAKERTVALDLTVEADRAKSRVLHRLLGLRVPGFERGHGPEQAVDADLTEEWQVRTALDADAVLIESAAYGATLESAATARLEEALLGAGGRVEVLSALLGQAVFMGLDALSDRVVRETARAVGSEPALSALGLGLERLLAIWRFDRVLGGARSAPIGAVIAAAFERGLWLFEGARGGSGPLSDPELKAVVALRDARRHAGAALGLDTARATAVMTRQAEARDAPPAARGAALGFLWSVAHFPDPGAAEAQAVRALRGAARPETFGDFLLGLFALAREEVLKTRGLVSAIDDVLGGLDDQDFLRAIAPLRLAFSYFPPAEKEALARTVLSLHGASTADPRALLQVEAAPEETARGAALDAAVTALMRRWGLEPAS